MKIMAIGAEKGGVGKSTTTLYLAARAAERLGSNAAHPTVAIVDRDRDQHLSGLWRRRSDVRRDSIILMPDTALPRPESGIELVVRQANYEQLVHHGDSLVRRPGRWRGLAAVLSRRAPPARWSQGRDA